jgi:hypothetical protein
VNKGLVSNSHRAKNKITNILEQEAGSRQSSLRIERGQDQTRKQYKARRKGSKAVTRRKALGSIQRLAQSSCLFVPVSALTPAYSYYWRPKPDLVPKTRHICHGKQVAKCTEYVVPGLAGLAHPNTTKVQHHYERHRRRDSREPAQGRLGERATSYFPLECRCTKGSRQAAGVLPAFVIFFGGLGNFNSVLHSLGSRRDQGLVGAIVSSTSFDQTKRTRRCLNWLLVGKRRPDKQSATIMRSYCVQTRHSARS